MKKTRRAAPKAEPVSPEDVAHDEDVQSRIARGERSWQSMTAPVEDDPWAPVEESLRRRREGDAERRWKFFSK